MGTFIAIFFVICLIIALLYVFLMVMLITGWLSLKSSADPQVKNVPVSILIPARNEEQNIYECLRSIAEQQYDHSLIEVIVIDDNSTDSTAEKVDQLKNVFPHISIKLIKLDENRTGKKQALFAGISAAKHDLIITIDADTTRGDKWLSSIASFYVSQDAKMIVGPVAYSDEKSWFEKMQSIEFTGLVAIAGGAIGAGKPVMCNGANLAFTKQAFEAAGGYSSDASIASGDDVMLMTRIDKAFPGSVKFLRCKEAVVYTRACSTLKQFIHQRVRWASKNRTAYNTASLAAGIIVLSMNLAVPAALILSIFIEQLFPFSLILLGLKCIIDFLFLFLAASFFEKTRFLFLFIPQALLYMLYVNVTGMLAMFSGYEWKGRRHR